jgi:uncharacterized protein YsxB (DUF464 family)
MIETLIRLDGRGLIQEVTVKGHGELGLKGSDPLCAAVTVLSGTFGRMLESQHRIGWEGKADKPGQFWIKVLSIPVSERDWFGGAGDYFLLGLQDLMKQFPQNIRVNIEVAEARHGT